MENKIAWITQVRSSVSTHAPARKISSSYVYFSFCKANLITCSDSYCPTPSLLTIEAYFPK